MPPQYRQPVPRDEFVALLGVDHAGAFSGDQPAVAAAS
jgi:hypothetical protein